MLDYRVDTFLSLCETKSYTQTAKALHLTQPSVTQHIKYLEQYYRCRLFTYDGRKVELTEAGAYLQKKAAILRAQNAEVRKHLYQINAEALFDIGMTSSVIGSPLFHRFCTAAKLVPGTRIQPHVENTHQLLRRLKNGTLDAAVLEGITSDVLYETVSLYTEQIIAVASPSVASELYGASLKQFLQFPLLLMESGCGLRELVQRHLSSRGISFYDFASLIELDSMTVLKELLYQGMGTAFLFTSTVQRDLEENRLRRIYVDWLSMYGSFYFVSMRGKLETQPMQEIIALLQDEETI